MGIMPEKNACLYSMAGFGREEALCGLMAGPRTGRRILGVGVDIEGIRRFEGYRNRSDPFLGSVFTDAELAYCFGKEYPPSHLAARFAAKEAVRKAILSFSPLVLPFRAIEILNRQNGAPSVHVSHEALEDHGMLVSLSHSAEYAIAFVVISGDAE